MRDYAKISPSIWGSRKFLSINDDSEARLLYFYIHTSPHGNSIGCYRLPKGYVMADLNWSPDQIDRAIEALCKALLIDWNETETIVQIADFLKQSPITNEKHAKGACKLALALPDCDIKARICAELNGSEYVKEKLPDIALPKPSDRPIPTETETNTETDTDNPPIPPKGKNARPKKWNDDLEKSFEAFWTEYPPAKVNPKSPAREEFAKAVAGGADPEALTKAATSYRHSLLDDDAPLPCHARTFLHQRRWEDFEPEESDGTYRAATPEEKAAWKAVTGREREGVRVDQPWPMVMVDGVEVPYPEAPKIEDIPPFLRKEA